jgi:HAD superfamily hydrolase (TIGR01509 family)
LPLLLDDPKHVPEAMARMDAYHQANNHLIEVFAGVARMLDLLQAADVRAAIWTGRDRESSEQMLRALKLDGHFAAVVCGDDLPTHKPDPEGLREVMRRLAVTPAETLFVGDADVDVLGGHACGVDTILIRHAREIAAEVLSKSWQSVATPAEAFDIVVKSVERAADGKKKAEV